MFTYYVSQIWGFLGSSSPPRQQLANPVPLQRLTIYMNTEQPPTNSAVYCSSFIYWQGVRFLYSPSRVMQQIPFEPPAWPPAWLDRFCTLTGQCLFRSAANHCFRIRQHVDLKGSKLIFVFFVFVYFSLWSNASNFTSLQGCSVFRNVSYWLTQWLTLSPIEIPSDSCLDR